MKPEYIEYLRSDHWRCLRAEAIAKWGDRCSNCAVPKIDVHHLRYGNLVDVTPDDLMPLCRRCHDNVHQSNRLRELLSSDETSEFKRKTVLGFLAGRDEAVTVKAEWQSEGANRDERRCLVKLKKEAANWREHKKQQRFLATPNLLPRFNGPTVLITRENRRRLRSNHEPWRWMVAVGINPKTSGWQGRAVGYTVPAHWLHPE